MKNTPIKGFTFTQCLILLMLHISQANCANHDKCEYFIEDFQQNSNPGKVMQVFREHDWIEYFVVTQKDQMGSIVHYERSTCHSRYTMIGVPSRFVNTDYGDSYQRHFTYDPAGNPTSVIVSDLYPGNVQYITRYQYDSLMQNTRQIEYTPGPDGTPLTADDTAYAYSDLTYDASGNLNTTIRYHNAGKDTLWFTGDDIASEYYLHRYAFAGYDQCIIMYNSQGPDAVWFTADDIMQSYEGSSFNVKGQTLIQDRLTIGTDNIWFTADDKDGYGSSHLTYTYNPAGELISVDQNGHQLTVATIYGK